MSSAQRTFREIPAIHTPIQVIPNYLLTTSNTNSIGTDISGVSYYSLDLKTAGAKYPFSGDVFFVDLFGVDNRGSNVDVSGSWVVQNGSNNSRSFYALVAFQVNTEVPASKAPGSEFTVFFKNVIPINSALLTIGLLGKATPVTDSNVPYLYSPPVPASQELYENSSEPTISPSLTFKSDGRYYQVVSSGPAGWIGLGNFTLLTAAGQTIWNLFH
jgi:hypothetical protein